MTQIPARLRARKPRVTKYISSGFHGAIGYRACTDIFRGHIFTRLQTNNSRLHLPCINVNLRRASDKRLFYTARCNAERRKNHTATTSKIRPGKRAMGLEPPATLRTVPGRRSTQYVIWSRKMAAQDAACEEFRHRGRHWSGGRHRQPRRRGAGSARALPTSAPHGAAHISSTRRCPHQLHTALSTSAPHGAVHISSTRRCPHQLHTALSTSAPHGAVHISSTRRCPHQLHTALPTSVPHGAAHISSTTSIL